MEKFIEVEMYAVVSYEPFTVWYVHRTEQMAIREEDRLCFKDKEAYVIKSRVQVPVVT